MNLGLLDILTAQQVERPDLGKSAEKLFQRASASRSDDRTFRNALEAAPATKLPRKSLEKYSETASLPVNPSVDTPVINTPASEPRVTPDVPNPGIPVDAGSLPNLVSNKPTAAEAAEADALAANNTLRSAIETLKQQILHLVKQAQETGDSVLLAQQDALMQALKALQGLLENGQGDLATNPLAALLALQDVNTSQQNTSNNNDNSTQGLQQAIDGITKLLSFGLLPEEAVKPLEEVVSQLQSLKPYVPTVADGTTDTSISELAEGIVEQAKTPEQLLQVASSDVKSDQIQDLLTGTSKDGDNTLTQPEQKTANTNQNAQHAAAQAKQQASDNAAFHQQLSSQTQQGRLDNQTTGNEKLAQSQAATTQQVVQQSNNSNTSQGDSQSFRQPDTFTPANLTNNATSAAPQTHEFVKFQKYLDSASLGQQQRTLLQQARSEQILAQIKFGVHTMPTGKDESHISIQLHPKELGTVDIRMEIAADGKTRIAILAEKTDTLNLLQKEASSLRAMLEDTLQTQSGQLNFSFHDQQDGQWKEFFNQAYSNPSYGSKGSANDNAANNNTLGDYMSSFVAADGLDIRV